MSAPKPKTENSVTRPFAPAADAKPAEPIAAAIAWPSPRRETSSAMRGATRDAERAVEAGANAAADDRQRVRASTRAIS